jgi:hypothetical protein
MLISVQISNILENTDFVVMLNQAPGDRRILAERLTISPEQLSYVKNSPQGEGLIKCEHIVLPFRDKFPKDTTLYKLMTTKPNEKIGA